MEFSSLINALAWTFFHSLWIGIIAALLAGAVISLTRKSSAQLRYNLLVAVMFFFLTTVSLVFVSEIKNGSVEISPVGVQEVVSSDFVRTSIEMEKAPTDERFFSGASSWINGNSPIIMLVWAVFFFLHFFRLFVGLIGVHRMRVKGIHEVSDEWQQKFSELIKRSGIREKVALFQSELVKVPVAIGYLKPIVLLPIGLIASIPASQVEAIILHELAHIKRRDYLVNLVQHFIDAVFFFNPAVKWVSSLIRLEREACCDDIVVRSTNEKKKYVEALIAFQEYSVRQPRLAMAITNKKSYLFSRVKRIATSENKKLNIMEKISLLCGVLIVSAFTYINEPQKEQKQSKVFVNVYEPKEYMMSAAEPELSGTIINSKIINAMPNQTQHTAKIDTVPEKVKTVTATISKEEHIERSKELKREENSENKADIREMEQESKEDAIQSKLNEIGKIKAEMQVVKDRIGEKKKQLNESEPKEEKDIIREIEKERAGLSGMRSHLEQKRVELEIVRKNHKYERPTIEQKAKLLQKKTGSVIHNKNETKIFESKKDAKLFLNSRRTVIGKPEKKEIQKPDVKADKFEVNPKALGKPGVPPAPKEPTIPVK